MIARILLVHASDTQALAAMIAKRLSGLDIAVERQTADKLNSAVDEADKIVALWSRGALVAGLDAKLKRVQGVGKLSVVRLASAATPPRLQTHIVSLPRPNDPDSAWRALAGAGPARAKTPAPAAERAYPGSRWHALLVAVLMSLVVAGAAYEANQTFAARVNAFASAVVAHPN